MSEVRNRDDMRPVAQALIDALGTRCVLLGDDVTSRSAGIWRSDTIKAGVLVRPETTEQVSLALSICHKFKQPVVTQGGLTGLVEGALTEPDDVIISLERMNKIESVNALERTMVVEAGVILQTIQETAEEHGLMFPLDLGGRGSCTIGGNISTNAGGNRVIRYGMTRDMVLGLEAVLVDGTIISSMNQMIKNNAGYDLKQLFIGTEGTLGVVTRAVLRCREQVVTQPTALVATSSFAQLSEFLKHVDGGLRGALSAFEVMWNEYYRLVTSAPAKNQAPMDSGYAYYILIEAMGADTQLVEQVLNEALEAQMIVDAVIAQTESQRMDLWALRDDVEQTFQFGPALLFDVSLRIGHMEQYVADVNAGLAARFSDFHQFTLGHVGDGNLHFAISVGSDNHEARSGVEAAVYEPLAAIGGSVSAEHGIGLEKKPYLPIARSVTEIELMRTLKRALDPSALLNRGKVVDC